MNYKINKDVGQENVKEIESDIINNDRHVISFESLLISKSKLYKKFKDCLLNFFSYLMPELTKHIKIKQHISKKLSNELLFMKGKHKNSCRNQSILYFTVHRCASRYVQSILKKFAEDSGMTLIDLGAYIWSGGKLYIKKEDVYKKLGYLYAPFYQYDTYCEELYPILDMDDYKIVLMLRDPRDVLTSYYFHHCYEIYDDPKHQEFIIERSKKALSKTIDEWAIENTQIFTERYKTYCEKLINRPNVLFLKYEDMIGDFNTWLYKLREFTTLNVKEDTIKSIVEKSSFNVDKEDVKSHKRQVTPGDHRRKLKKETINFLNSQFKEILDILRY